MTGYVFAVVSSFIVGLVVAELIWRWRIRREWRLEILRLRETRRQNREQVADQVAAAIRAFHDGDRGDYDAELAILATLSAALMAFVVYWATSAGVL